MNTPACRRDGGSSCVLTQAPSSHLQIAAAIVAYDKLIASELKSFGEACKAVGGIVEQQGKSVM